MAPPALVNLDNYSDVSFRDTFIRHQNQVAPTANIIQKLYHHVTGNTANLSAAEVVSVDGSQQGQWDLLLSTSANKLNVNTINTATTGTWSANAIMSVRQATTTIRSANVVVNNLTVAGNASHSSLNVSGISNFNGTDFRRFRRLLSGATNSMVEICEVQITRSPFTVELDITDEDSVTKKYLFAVHQEANTNNQFQRLLPLSATDNGKIHVEMRLGIFNSSRVTFRLVRTELDLTSSTPVDCHFKICHDPAFPVIFHELSETSIVTPATAIYSGTALTQVDGSVGINKSDPAFPLDVVGAANVSGSLAVAGNVAIDTNTLVVDSVANRVGILTATPLHPLDVTGDINSTGSLRINNTQVLSATALGSGVVSSSLTSVGILSSLDVTGAATVGSMGVGGVLTAGAIAAASLTASGNVSAANLTGTIRTTAQPIITSVGTLTSLAVAGNVAIDTNTLVVNSVANRVGIATTTPLHPLDVTGDINSTGSLRINNTQVLSATALGSGVVSSSLTSVGILSSLDVTGAATVGSMGVGGVLTAGAIAAASLTASGNVSAANLTGTIRTADQPIITSVGTLASLAVAGNVAIDTNTLVVNSVANRVGIATTTPLHPLDVTGNINSTGSLLINNTRVLSATALGSGVQSSNLTSVGTLTSLNVGGNLTVSGPVSMTSSNNTFDSMVTISLTRTITGNTVGSGVSIGRIGRILSSPDGSSMIELRVISNSGNNMTSKSYEIPHNTDIGISGTRRVIARSGISLTNEVGIDAIRTEDKLDLKLVRTRVDSSVDPGTFHISLIIHYDKGSTFTLENAWTPSTTTYTSTLPEVLTGNDYYPGSSIVQSSGFVGIRVENPIFPLDVGGDAAFRGSLFALETGHKIDCENYYSANVMINTTTVLSGALVGNIFCGGSFTLDITLNHFMNDNNTVSKTYTIPVQKGIIFNGGNWARALPTNATVTTNSGVAENDIDLDIRTPDSPNINGDIRLAIVRSRASASVNTTSPICVSIVARYNKFASQMTFGRETGTYTGFAANNTNIAVTTLMTSCAADGIGIYCEPKDSPYWFDVDSPTTTAASNFRTSLNLDTTRTNRCFLSFGNMWRLFYNTNTQNLEIHKNSNPNDPFWGTFTVTGILAAQ
jgi:diphthamide synthase (EF-2-diphthine--ammonia ligase)